MNLAALAALSATVFAAPDRVQVGAPGANVTREFSPRLYVAAAPPSGYARHDFDGDGGTWTGPDGAWISWSVRFREAAGGLEQAARGATIQGYPEIASGTVPLKHVVAGREVGQLTGTFVLDQLPPDVSARAEAALAFSLGRGVTAVAGYFAGAPFAPEDRIGDVPAGDWNRDALTQAVRGVALEGDLPPARVRVRAAGRTVRGRVTDDFGDPVAAAPVRLQRRTRPGWRTVRRGRTRADGTFALRVRGRGRYRVLASLAAAHRTSRAIRASA